MMIMPEMVQRAAEAIANARLKRAGNPPLERPLELLSPAVRDGLLEDARVALAAGTEGLQVKKPSKPRGSSPTPEKRATQRNILLDTLALIEGHNLQQIPPKTWSRLAGALKEIKTVCPDINENELRRRAMIYRKKWPDRDLTANALAMWWGSCGELAAANGGVRKADNVR